MDIEEIRQKREELRAQMSKAIHAFMDETKCVPQISIEYHTIQKIGAPTDHIPRIDIGIVI